MPSITRTLTLSIASHDHEIEAEIQYRYVPGRRGSRDSLGGVRGAGPPLEPDDPAECEVTGAMVSSPLGTNHIYGLLSDDQLSALADACLEDHQDDGPDPDIARERQQDAERAFPSEKGDEG